MKNQILNFVLTINIRNISLILLPINYIHSLGYNLGGGGGIQLFRYQKITNNLLFPLLFALPKYKWYY